MILLLALVIFLVLPTLLVWRLSRVPIRGDIQLQLLWRGAVAGMAGGSIGATLSSLTFGLKGYGPIGYLYWLIVTAILGMIFTLLIGAVQKSLLSLSLLGRAAIGGVIGAATAWLWVSVISTDVSGGRMNWFRYGVICMLVGSGVVSGILGGPLKKEG